MSKMVVISRITSGMVLEKAVKNKYGQLLIPENTVIEEKDIYTLAAWGISSVHVKSENDDSDYYASNDAQKTEWLEALCSEYGWIPRNQNEDDLFEMVMMLKLDTL
jgi:hypothetical protein